MSQDKPAVESAGPCQIGSPARPAPPQLSVLRLLLARVISKQGDREAGA